jgi:hypothetical protein
VGPLGLEPRTPGLKGRCSNQLSYRPSLLSLRLIFKIEKALTLTTFYYKTALVCHMAVAKKKKIGLFFKLNY